jgi:NAD(P)-dependent dehydrogenase (short-subunit alcohol dehydrogenase family)
MDLHLSGKRAVVTGSTKGIGRGIATALLREGAEVVIHGRNLEETRRAAQQLSEHGGRAVAVAADLESAEGARAFIQAVDALGPVDILVNNVGIFSVKRFEEVTDEEWQHYFELNVLSAVRLSRHYLPGMLERNQGRILMIASEAGLKPLPHMVHYSVTKTALISLARGLAELTKGTRVTVNSVLPGPTWTEGVEAYMVGVAREANTSVEQAVADYFKKVEPASLIQRFAKVEEVADLVAFLCSDRASAINGTSQRVEGGIVRHL